MQEGSQRPDQAYTGKTEECIPIGRGSATAAAAAGGGGWQCKARCQRHFFSLLGEVEDAAAVLFAAVRFMGHFHPVLEHSEAAVKTHFHTQTTAQSTIAVHLANVKMNIDLLMHTFTQTASLYIQFQSNP